MIDMTNISKRYKMGGDTIDALDHVDLHVADREFVAIIGPSGSGKSTLMNIVGCLDYADEGSYFLDSEDVSKLSDRNLAIIRNRKIGFVFQQFNLLGKLSAYENVELPLIYQGLTAAERKARVEEALIQVGLKERMRHKPKELSGGQQQRVAIARALSTQPALILADEPTGNLDSKSGREIIALFHELHARGNTIMLITHDEKISMEAERRMAIYDGRIMVAEHDRERDAAVDDGAVAEDARAAKEATSA
ncbi:MAG: ABC transporter ATP-binding protein [Christensenellaceae bacterium]|nr:ABC transporter ATP-binding protein [Christensenellaceae bacterium]MEA5068598.1 ABC transporter ATP-binding protein [Christensenellaceae bacterium]